jgi:hypothetical protein
MGTPIIWTLPASRWTARRICLRPSRFSHRPGSSRSASGARPRCQSLTTETVTGANGSITTPAALTVNPRLGVTDSTIAEQVTDGVYALRGWGIGSSFAIEAPNGWIIVDTGDSTQAAAEMRETLERAVGKKIKVAAILLTHWHMQTLRGEAVVREALAVPAVLDAKGALNYHGGLEYWKVVHQTIQMNPQGKTEANWIKTNPKKGFFAYFRWYSPTNAFFDRSWKMGNIEELK